MLFCVEIYTFSLFNSIKCASGNKCTRPWKKIATRLPETLHNVIFIKVISSPHRPIAPAYREFYFSVFSHQVY